MQVKNISSISLLLILLFLGTIVSAQKNQTDDLGRKQGEWVKFKNGVKFYKGQFKDNYPVGEFLRYYPSGRLKMKSIYSGMGKLRFTEFFQDERKTTLKAKGMYLEKRKDSLWMFYNEEGVLIGEEYYANDTAHGTWKLYDYLGHIVKETVYNKGKIHGIQKEYFESGEVKREMTFDMDQLNGNMKIYFPDGKIRIEGFYKLGIQDKAWVYYFPDATVMFIETYEDGMMLHRLDPAGKAIEMEFETDTTRLDIDPSEFKME